MRILYVSHTALVSGAERSLLELLAALGPTGIEPVLASPQGPLAVRARALGVHHVPIRGLSATLKLHPARTPVALGEMALAAQDVRRAVRQVGADIVHANSARAGLIVAGAGCPTVVHLRDTLPEGRVGAAIRTVLERQTSIIAISHHVAEPLSAEANVTVLHNPVDLERFDPATVDRATARRALGIRGAAPALGVVAQITPWKGQDTAIEALALLRRTHPDATLLLAGEAKFVARRTTFDNLAFERRLHALAGPGVRFLGETEAVPELLAALDLLLVPSWCEPFGRSIIEAMAMGTPVLATDQGGPPEIIVDGANGRLVPPRDPHALAAQASALLRDPDERRVLGQAALVAARQFDRDAYATRVAGLYAATADRVAVRPVPQLALAAPARRYR